MASELAAVFKSFEWIFSVDEQIREQSSQTLSNEEIDFKIRLLPYHSDADRSSSRGGVSVFLDVLSVPPQQPCAIIKFQLTIRNQKDSNLSVSMDDEKLLDPTKMTREGLQSWGFKRFMSQDLLVDAQAGYQVEGKIVIEALISVQRLRQAQDSDDSGVRVSVVRPAHRHPIMVIVACSEDFRKHDGPGLVNFDRVLRFSLSANMPAAELRNKLQQECVEDAAILPCQLVEGPRGRAFPTRVDIQKPLKDVQISRNSIQDLVRPLGAREWRLIVLKRDQAAGLEEGGVLVFLKFFDNQTRSMELVGNTVLKPDATVSSLLPKVNGLVGLMPTEPLFVWLDTGSGNPRRLQDTESCEGIGLVSGAVLYFQKQPGEGAEASGLSVFLSGFSDRIALSLHPLHQGGQLLSLNLGSSTTSAQLLTEISSALTLAAGTLVSIFPLEPSLAGPRACAVGGHQLSETVSSLLSPGPDAAHQRNASKLLYYEVRRARPERTVHVSWFGPKVVMERVFDFTVSAMTSVGEILGRLRQMGPLSGTGDIRLVGTWKHRIVWVAGGSASGSGFTCGEESDALSALNSQVTLRAEEVADDAFGAHTHHRLVQVTHIRLPLRADVDYHGEPFLMSIAPEETVEGVWSRIVGKLGLRNSRALACIAPGCAPTILDQDQTPLLQHIAQAPGSCLAIVHPAADDSRSSRPPISHASPARQPSTTSHARPSPPDEPPAMPAAGGLQPGLWARLSAAVDDDTRNTPLDTQPPDPALMVEPGGASHPLSFPLPIPHSSSHIELPSSPVDRSVDLTFELETLKSELMEERLMVEGLQLELRRLTEERIDERLTRTRLEESLDDAQAELASALEQNAVLQRDREAAQQLAAQQQQQQQDRMQTSPIDIVKDLIQNHVQHASVPILNSLEASAKDLLAAIAEVRKAKRGVPDSFLCPITQDIMKDPVVVVQTGHTYERVAIERWFESCSTDPKTNVQLHSRALVPNHGLRATIEEYQANQ